MSRFREWTSTYGKILNWIEENTKTKTYSQVVSRTKNNIHNYCNKHKIQGSFTDKVLYIRQNYNVFINHLKKKYENSNV